MIASLISSLIASHPQACAVALHLAMLALLAWAGRHLPGHSA